MTRSLIQGEMTADMIAWTELTTADGQQMSRFYSKVLGVGVAPLRMDDYDDYNVPADPPSFGICHPRSSDGKIPPGWIVYLRVKKLDDALLKVKDLGGEVLAAPRTTKGYGTHAVIRDPAGNVTALYEEENRS